MSERSRRPPRTTPAAPGAAPAEAVTRLLLGAILRRATTNDATVWMETDGRAGPRCGEHHPGPSPRRVNDDGLPLSSIQTFRATAACIWSSGPGQQRGS